MIPLKIFSSTFLDIYRKLIGETYIFERLLNVQHIDLFDDFNDCGGHSLLIFTLLVEIKKHIGVLLTTMDVKVATLASLSGIIDGVTN